MTTNLVEGTIRLSCTRHITAAIVAYMWYPQRTIFPVRHTDNRDVNPGVNELLKVPCPFLSVNKPLNPDWSYHVHHAPSIEQINPVGHNENQSFWTTWTFLDRIFLIWKKAILKMKIFTEGGCYVNVKSNGHRLGGYLWKWL